MKISVAIPTLNEESHIVKTLQGVFRQDGDYEVNVVDGGSTDDTVSGGSFILHLMQIILY